MGMMKGNTLVNGAATAFALIVLDKDSSLTAKCCTCNAGNARWSMPTPMPEHTPVLGQPLINSSLRSCFTLEGQLSDESPERSQRQERRRNASTVFLPAPASGLTGVIDKPASQKVVGFEVMGSVRELMAYKIRPTDCLGQIEICLELNW